MINEWPHVYLTTRYLSPHVDVASKICLNSALYLSPTNHGIHHMSPENKLQYLTGQTGSHGLLADHWKYKGSNSYQHMPFKTKPLIKKLGQLTQKKHTSFRIKNLSNDKKRQNDKWSYRKLAQ